MYNRVVWMSYSTGRCRVATDLESERSRERKRDLSSSTSNAFYVLPTPPPVAVNGPRLPACLVVWYGILLYPSIPFFSLYFSISLPLVRLFVCACEKKKTSSTNYDDDSYDSCTDLILSSIMPTTRSSARPEALSNVTNTHEQYGPTTRTRKPGGGT